jgi:hypothetical protein
MKEEKIVRYKGLTIETEPRWVWGVPVVSVNDRWYMIHGATEDAINTYNEVDFYYTEVDPETVAECTSNYNGIIKRL